MLSIFVVLFGRAAKFSLISFAALTILSITSLALRAQEAETLENAMVAPTDSGDYYMLNRLPESLRKSQPFARDFHEFIEHAGTSGTIDRAAYFSTFEEARQDMMNSSRLALKSASAQNVISGQWTNLGLEGVAGDNTTPSAGITTVIVFNPKNPATMYSGGSGGGVWKSFDTGEHWLQMTDNYLPNLSVASIAIDPVDTNNVYVGTGYGYTSTPEYSGTGLYKSTDAGQTWNRLSGGLDSGSFIKVVVDPAKDSIVLASAFDGVLGVFRSTDYGKTWKSVFPHGIVWDIIATPGPSNTSIFYMICGSDAVVGAGANAGVYKSIDEGITWTNVTKTANFYPAASIGRAALASPLNAPKKVFALMTNPSGSASELFETQDAGSTWDSVNVPSDVFVISSFNNYPQGWYDLAIAVTPNSITSDTIYVDGVVGYVLRGTGTTWQQFSDYNHANGGSGYTHVDHHAFAISPVNPNIVYDGDDGGLWVNYAGGSNDVKQTGGWILHSHGIISNRFYHFCFDHSDSTATWAGAQDQGVWKLANGQSPTQRGSLPLGDAMQPLLSSTTNNKFAEGPNGLLYTTNQTPENWAEIPDTAAKADLVGWDAPFKMSPILHGGIPGSSILYLGRQHLLVSTNGGNKWTQFSPTFSGGDYCTAIGLTNRAKDSVIYAGGYNQLELSTNWGATWVSRNTGLASGEVSSINTSWQDTNFVLVSLRSSNTKLMKSTDLGAHWTNVSGTVIGSEIPGAGANQICNVESVALDSINPLTTWYAATDWGMYSTTDAGQDWSFMGPGLLPCHDVQLASNGTTLRVATYGRGIWEYSNYSQSGVEMTSLSATKSANGTALAWYVDGEPAGATFSVERSIDGESFQSIRNMDGLGAAPTRQNYSFTDPTTAPGTYLYRIHEIDLDGSARYSNSVELHYGTDQIYVYQPYPNPFIPNGASQVTLSYELPARDNAQIRIYSMTGVLVKTIQNGSLDGGPHTALWDGRDSEGNIVASGAYIFSVQTGLSGSLQSKIVVMRE